MVVGAAWQRCPHNSHFTPSWKTNTGTAPSDPDGARLKLVCDRHHHGARLERNALGSCPVGWPRRTRPSFSSRRSTRPLSWFRWAPSSQGQTQQPARSTGFPVGVRLVVGIGLRERPACRGAASNGRFLSLVFAAGALPLGAVTRHPPPVVVLCLLRVLSGRRRDGNRPLDAAPRRRVFGGGRSSCGVGACALMPACLAAFDHAINRPRDVHLRFDSAVRGDISPTSPRRGVRRSVTW